MAMLQHLSLLDKCIIEFDHALKLLTEKPVGQRPNPAKNEQDIPLLPTEKSHTVALMRINHAGEISAQALYRGQALTADLPFIRKKLTEAALEEIDHLNWCRDRLEELKGHTSYLDPFWYLGSFIIGAIAGLAGDHWSLGFIAETENQVSAHLSKHLNQLNPNDKKTNTILKQMQIDEEKHAAMAKISGGIDLPAAIQQAMQLLSKVMTSIAYYV